ncbi:MAG: urease accessory protein UreE [Campylobacteraceae bacterium]
MIKKVVKLNTKEHASDSVELSWFDMHKPNLTAITQKGVEFIVKVKGSHLHVNDILVCDDGYAIAINRAHDDVYILEFKDALLFAKTAYEIGNRHQPINIENNKITALQDLSIEDIILNLERDESVSVAKTKTFFKSNAKASHSH